MTFVEKQPSREDQATLGLQWANVVRLPRSGRQFVVAPKLPDGELDMENGYRGVYREYDEPNRIRDFLAVTHEHLDWYVWGRFITEFIADDERP